MVVLTLLGVYPVIWRTFMLIYWRFALPHHAPLVEVQSEEVMRGLTNQSLIYIDVRDQSDLVNDGRIPGSYLIPVGELQSAFDMSAGNFSLHYGFSKPSKEATNIVLGCFGCPEAERAIGVLRELGYSLFKIYRGSFLDWAEKGGPISHLPKNRNSIEVLGT